jgi:ferredoxin
MIIYFSATGNNKYLAQRISGENEEIISIIKAIKEDKYEINVPKDESLGIIVPRYFWGLPSIVEDFLSKVKINTGNDSYIYAIASYGTTTGNALGKIKHYLDLQDIELNAQYEVKMPDTWTVMFDLSDKNEIDKQTEYVEEQLDNITPMILNKQSTPTGTSIFYRISSIFSKRMYENSRKTKHLHVQDNCTGCKLCSTSCPVNAISMVDEKPVWTKDKCVMCLRCLHRCPTFAIQYDNKTINHGQYTNKNITDFD